MGNTSEHRRRTIRLLKTMLLFLCVALLCTAVFGAAYLFGFDITSRLDPQKIFGADQSTLIYDQSGAEVANIHGLENRIWVDFHNIPLNLQNAVIAVEDIRFYSHAGIDVRRIFGALINDIKAGQLVEGASTITQQLIKNSLLVSKKTWSRKIEEALLALELERRYSKEEILEMYLNYSYFGGHAYGVEAAAQTYFSKSVSNLTLGECALIIGITKSPARYAPHLNPQASVERRDHVLNMMVQGGFISAEQAQGAKEEPLQLNLRSSTITHGYYMDAMLEEAADLLGVSYEDIISGGYRIQTGLNTQLQTICETAFLNDSLFPAAAADGTPVQGSIVCIDPKTGLVSAIMGGRKYEVQRGLHRAITSRRQPGSAIKPILVYAPALQAETVSTTSVFNDAKKTFGTYAPKNYADKYYGMVTLRQCIIHSLNTPAVEILQTVGIEQSKAFAKQVGIPFGNADNGLSLALGGFEVGVTPLELCGAYTALASQGNYMIPRFVNSITDKDGKVLYQRNAAPTRVLSAEDAFLLTDMLQDVVEEGTGKKLSLANIPLSGKTGTNGYGESGNRDIWMAAYNQDIAAVMWMGFDKTDTEHCLAPATTGGTFPALMLSEVFGNYYRDKQAPLYTAPATLEAMRLRRDQLLLGKLQTAPAYLLDTDVVEEYLTADQREQLAAANAQAHDIANFTVVLEAEMGLPVISFNTANPTMRFTLYRDDTTQKGVVLDTLSGPSLSYIDTSALSGKTYTYYVVPVDEEGSPLGDASVRISLFVP